MLPAEVRDRNVSPSFCCGPRSTPNGASCRPSRLGFRFVLAVAQKTRKLRDHRIRRKQHCRLAIAFRASRRPKQPHQLFERRRLVVVKRPEFPLQPPALLIADSD